MLLHQTDRLLIGPLTSSIMAEFNLNEVQMGGIVSGSLILGSIFYPIWGYLFDRFARPKLLALASFIWGITTWLSAVAPTPQLFLISRASTGIDDSSYSGIASLISDYFPPQKRSRIFGLLQLSIPLGYLLGLLLALHYSPRFGWRMIYIFTGFLGLVLALLIYFGVKDIPRGASEPALTGNPEALSSKIQLTQIKQLFRITSLRYLFLQGFIGVLPWQIITFWSFRYLEVERNYSAATISSTMIPAVLMIGAGYFAGGFIGDAAFKRNPLGRLQVSIISILLGAVCLGITLNIPLEGVFWFRIMLAITSFFIPLASPNIASSVYDIVLPEVRSTAIAIQYFLGNLGSALAPLLAGIIGQYYSLKTALLGIGITAWLITAAVLALSTRTFKEDGIRMRSTLQERSSS
jgi:MFS family permease